MNLTLAALFALTAPGFGPPQPDLATDQPLAGTWIVVRMERFGQAENASVGDKWVFAPDEIVIKFGNIPDPVHYTFKIDSSKYPRWLDLRISAGNGAGTEFQAIWEQDRDTLKICVATKGRPKQLATAANDNGEALYFLKRAGN